MTKTRMPSASTFLGMPFASLPLSQGADFAFLGIPFCLPYGPAETPVVSPSRAAPDWVRAATAGWTREGDRYDFDLGGTLIDEGELNLIDCGDVVGDPRDRAGSAEAATEVVRDIARCGAVPLVVGGDHATPPLVVRGLDDGTEVNVLHIDAHLDFRDEVNGLRDGYSSPIRRLRELSCVRDIIQVGLRGTGSARSEEVEAAIAAGNVLITAEEVHEQTTAIVTDRISRGARYYITIDVDGMDPSYAPATGWPLPGGLTFPQLAGIVRHVARNCEVIGLDVCELVPSKDVNGLTGLVIARLLMNVIGLVSRGRRAVAAPS